MLAAMVTEALPARLHTEVSLSLTVIVVFTAVAVRRALQVAFAAGAGAGVVAGLGAYSDSRMDQARIYNVWDVRRAWGEPQRHSHSLLP
jgi:hypothetical protein